MMARLAAALALLAVAAHAQDTDILPGNTYIPNGAPLRASRECFARHARLRRSACAAADAPARGRPVGRSAATRHAYAARPVGFERQP